MRYSVRWHKKGAPLRICKSVKRTNVFVRHTAILIAAILLLFSALTASGCKSTYTQSEAISSILGKVQYKAEGGLWKPGSETAHVWAEVPAGKGFKEQDKPVFRAYSSFIERCYYSFKSCGKQPRWFRITINEPSRGQWVFTTAFTQIEAFQRDSAPVTKFWDNVVIEFNPDKTELIKQFAKMWFGFAQAGDKIALYSMLNAEAAGGSQSGITKEIIDGESQEFAGEEPVNSALKVRYDIPVPTDVLGYRPVNGNTRRDLVFVKYSTKQGSSPKKLVFVLKTEQFGVRIDTILKLNEYEDLFGGKYGVPSKWPSLETTRMEVSTPEVKTGEVAAKLVEQEMLALSNGNPFILGKAAWNEKERLFRVELTSFADIDAKKRNAIRKNIAGSIYKRAGENALKFKGVDIIESYKGYKHDNFLSRDMIRLMVEGPGDSNFS